MKDTMRNLHKEDGEGEGIKFGGIHGVFLVLWWCIGVDGINFYLTNIVFSRSNFCQIF